MVAGMLGRKKYMNFIAVYLQRALQQFRASYVQSMANTTGKEAPDGQPGSLSELGRLTIDWPLIAKKRALSSGSVAAHTMRSYPGARRLRGRCRFARAFVGRRPVCVV
jgi:hypothetical protein